VGFREVFRCPLNQGSSADRLSGARCERADAHFTAAGAGASPGDFTQIYGNYGPDFVERDRINRDDPHKLSLEKWFYNMAQVEHDYRVEAVVKKADELFKAKDWRGR